MAFTPDVAQGDRQTGSWLVVGGSGAYEETAGKGEMDVVYGPNPDSPTDVTFTGAVTR